jgi:ribose transport system substrate-binding protein
MLTKARFSVYAALLGAMVAIVALLYGGSAAGSRSTKSPAQVTIGLDSVLSCQNAIVCEWEKAFSASVQALGAKVVVKEATNIANLQDDQIKNFDLLTAQHVNAIVVWPQDTKAVAASIHRAVSAGIPVIGTEIYGGVSGLTSTVNQGRALGGYLNGKAACMHSPPGGGTVLYGQWHLPNQGNEVQFNYFKRAITECHKKIKIVMFYNATDDVAGGQPTAAAALAHNSDTFAIVAYNDPTAIGAARAAKDAGVRNKVFIAGYNLGPDGVSALKRGEIDQSEATRAAVLAQEAAIVAVKYATGADKNPPRFLIEWPKCYTTKTAGQIPTLASELAAIKAGKRLSSSDPALVQTGNTLPNPGNNLLSRGCQ